MVEDAVPVTKENVPYLLAEAEKHVKELSAKSHIFDEERENSFPRLRMSELDLGRVLGRGGFCEVKEISGIQLGDPMAKPRYEKEEDDRAFLASHCLRNLDARYAIKTLGPHTREDAILYMKGAIDLATEARFLAVVENPNICRMRAVSECGPYEDGFFLVLDRLYGILEDRIVEWSEKDAKRKSLANLFSAKAKQRITEGMLTRLGVAFDICHAMLHFHRHNIIYRDLKPENIGFDVRDDVKIFDLGLAKEVRKEDMLPDGTWNLTGMTGSLRYMAPEVAKEKPYNLSADVYSFSILLWQIMSLKTPFDGFGVSIFHDMVVEKGYRPEMDKKWPKPLQDILKKGWSKVISERPSLDDVAVIIQHEIGVLGDANGNQTDQVRISLRDKSIAPSKQLARMRKTI